MKKIISIILATALLMCMSVTVFAEQTSEGTQTVTVEVPDREFTMSIPATTAIEYGNSDVVILKNELKITSKNPTLLFSNAHYVQVDVTYSDLTHKDNKSYTLPLSIMWAEPNDPSCIAGGYEEAYDWENLASRSSVKFTSATDFYWTNGYRLGAKVTGWDNAEPGEYQATVTYTATIKP